MGPIYPLDYLAYWPEHRAQRHGAVWPRSKQQPRNSRNNGRSYDVRRSGSQSMRWAGKPG